MAEVSEEALQPEQVEAEGQEEQQEQQEQQLDEAPVEESQQQSPAAEDDENDGGGPPPGAPDVVEEEEQQQQEKKVVAEYTHGQAADFNETDLRDVVKIQSIYRQKKAKETVQQYKTRRHAEELAARKEFPPIVMPAADPLLAAGKNGVEDGSSGSSKHTKKKKQFANVDYSRLSTTPLSADTQGMQTIYSRMLRSKAWW